LFEEKAGESRFRKGGSVKYFASLVIAGVWSLTYFLASHGIPAVPALVVISLVAVMAMRKILTKQSSPAQRKIV
jgi:CHASE2 domain-containing sensor protein